MVKNLITLALGFAFGCLLIGSQAFSWYRIQEMFHFQSFHMYGLLLSAIATAAISILIIKKGKLKSVFGNPVEIKPKKTELKANIIGGLLFGIGWGIAGSCSAPVYVLVGLHWQIGLILFAGAMLGAILYGILENKLPK